MTFRISYKTKNWLEIVINLIMYRYHIFILQSIFFFLNEKKLLEVKKSMGLFVPLLSSAVTPAGGCWNNSRFS